MARRALLPLVLLPWLSGCPDGGPAPDATTDAGEAAVPDAPDAAAPDPRDCDPLVPAQCAMPWPSNLYLAPDPSRVTGYTLRFGAATLPARTTGEHVEPGPYTRLDGYSPGTAVLVHFPDLDLAQFNDEEHLERSLAADARVLWFEVRGTTLRRVPCWVEADANEPDPARRTLFVRPAVILDEATRYVVAFRELRDTRGQPVAPSPAFARLRDHAAGNDPALAPRQARFEEVFAMLAAQGVARPSLTLAWDFVTASSPALHGRMLAMRDDAFRRAGPQGPELVVDATTEYTTTENADIAFELNGHFDAPHYLRMTRHGALGGWEFNLDAQGRPLASGTHRGTFVVRVPRSALDGTPHGVVLYGHGLMGSTSELRGGYLGQVARSQRLVLVAANLLGMSTEDTFTVLAAMRDFRAFPWIADRLHQGLLEWLLLARSLRERLGALPALSGRGVHVNRDELFYYGNSQGGIFGGSFLALSQDITRGCLGVAGSNYATLLQRSTDFDRYYTGVRASYPVTMDQTVLLSMAQLLWDGTDPVTYYRHLSAQPFADTPAHAALFALARGDKQVAVLTTEVAARSGLEIPLMSHYDGERAPWGIVPQDYPHRGSGVVLWSYGNPWPSPGNHPPQDGLPDPHESPRRDARQQEQMSRFLRTGEITDVCGGAPCVAR